MRERKRLTAMIGVALLVVAFFGCSPILVQDPQPNGWYIKLRISDPTVSKAINVSEHSVTGLNIQVFDTQDQLIGTFVWAAVDGSESHLVPVNQEGRHKILVTHISEENGKVVTVEESAYFNIQAMLITVIDIVPGFIGTINVDSGDPKSDGTVTISVTDLAAPDGTSVLAGVYEAGVNPMIDPLGLIQAMGHTELLEGAASDTLKLPNSEDIWMGTGGSFYDVYVWVDMNDNLDVVMYAEPGIDLQLSAFPVVVEIDGDTVLGLVGSDFIVAPGP